MECTFCGLLRRGDARWVARAPAAVAFAPLDPIAPGHAVVIPIAHHEGIFDTPAVVLAATMELVQNLAITMRTSLGVSGVDILNASGPGSEQSVPHLHFHLVPRWPDDGFSTWPSECSNHRFVGDPIERLAQAADPFSGRALDQEVMRVSAVPVRPRRSR